MKFQNVEPSSLQHSASRAVETRAQTAASAEVKSPQAPSLPMPSDSGVSKKSEQSQLFLPAQKSSHQKAHLKQLFLRSKKFLEGHHLIFPSLCLSGPIPMQQRGAYIMLAKMLRASQVGDLEILEQQWDLLRDAQPIPTFNYADAYTKLYQTAHDFYFDLAEKASQTHEWDAFKICIIKLECCSRKCSNLQYQTLEKVQSLQAQAKSSFRQHLFASAFSEAMQGRVSTTRSHLEDLEFETASLNLHEVIRALESLNPIYLYEAKNYPDLTEFLEDPDRIISEFGQFSYVLMNQSVLMSISKIADDFFTKTRPFTEALKRIHTILQQNNLENGNQDIVLSEKTREFIDSLSAFSQVDVLNKDLLSSVSEEKVLGFIQNISLTPFCYSESKNDAHIQTTFHQMGLEIVIKSNVSDLEQDVLLPDDVKLQMQNPINILLSHGASYTDIEKIIKQLIQTDIRIHQSLKNEYIGPDKDDMPIQWLTAQVLSLICSPNASKFFENLSNERFLSPFRSTPYAKIEKTGSNESSCIRNVYDVFYHYQKKSMQLVLKGVSRLEKDDNISSRSDKFQSIQAMYTALIKSSIVDLRQKIEAVSDTAETSSQALTDMGNDVQQGLTYIDILKNKVTTNQEYEFFRSNQTFLHAIEEKIQKHIHQDRLLGRHQVKHISDALRPKRNVRFTEDTVITYNLSPWVSNDESEAVTDEDVEGSAAIESLTRTLEAASHYADEGDILQAIETVSEAKDAADASDLTIEGSLLKDIVQTAYQNAAQKILKMAFLSAERGNVELTFNYLQSMNIYAKATNQRMSNVIPIAKHAYVNLIRRCLSILDSKSLKNPMSSKSKDLEWLKNQAEDAANSSNTKSMHQRIYMP